MCFKLKTLQITIVAIFASELCLRLLKLGADKIFLRFFLRTRVLTDHSFSFMFRPYLQFYSLKKWEKMWSLRISAFAENISSKNNIVSCRYIMFLVSFWARKIMKMYSVWKNNGWLISISRGGQTLKITDCVVHKFANFANYFWIQ